MRISTSLRRGAPAAILALALVATMATGSPASAAPPVDCVTAPGGAVLVTPDCNDPLYAAPVIDSESDETEPVAHHKVSGHFEGTQMQFNIYLPPADTFQGRFFQYTYPLTDANATARAIGFGAENGGYTVQAGSSTGNSLGYRHDAAAAKFAETVASAYYGVPPTGINGYLYGASGGSFQTIGAAESTTGVWQGFVPMVMGTPMSTPYTFFIRAMARLVLADKAQQISDAVLPGGSGDPYAGLDAAESAMLRELTAFGVPLRGWEDPDYLLGLSAPDGLLGFGSVVQAIDPSYADDFWSKPGYLGTEQSPLGDEVRAALAAGGDRWDIALRSYYRHQLPPADSGYYGFDQFRDAAGSPLYPQRSLVVGPLVLRGSSGNASYSGQIHGKMIVVDNLLDVDAMPWHADWYAKRVAASLGQSEFRNNFRLYYNDNADHLGGDGDEGHGANRLISYWGVPEQALRDLSAWVEKGTPAPASTKYTATNAQIEVPRLALARKGVQPVVDVTANLHSDVVHTRVGRTVAFAAVIQLPGTAGRVVTTEWDFPGTGDFVERRFVGSKLGAVGATSYTFTQPGTYYVGVRVTAQRGNPSSAFGRVQNIDRIRIVVE
ncbi:PKD domain-containing protein [Microbacterium yannicii]|uniref:PKD domain-containing protein n=1 Tax=Microbacterium yannicii TaxID=671622 RepID=UPI001888F534|nr:PKD domain-containing protein [Microbacterium yannicii]MCO5954435.1 hypothetical protein [Microbacterium yannicii]